MALPAIPLNPFLGVHSEVLARTNWGEQFSEAITAEQLVYDSDFPGAVAETVTVCPATIGLVSGLKLQIPPDAVVDSTNVPL